MMVSPQTDSKQVNQSINSFKSLVAYLHRTPPVIWLQAMYDGIVPSGGPVRRPTGGGAGARAPPHMTHGMLLGVPL